MLRVGLTGGVASGKSTLAGLLAGLGAAVCDADVLVEELYRPGRPGATAVTELFGPTAIAADGSVDRPALAELVLADSASRRRLEARVHPLVRAAFEGWFAALAHGSPTPAVAVVEAALLVESGAYRDHHRLVVVSAPASVRRARALAAGWPAEKLERILAAQLDDAAREAVADYVVRNEDGLEALSRKAGELWAWLVEDAQALDAGRALAKRSAK